jgi:hypothetical protein
VVGPDGATAEVSIAIGESMTTGSPYGDRSMSLCGAGGAAREQQDRLTPDDALLVHQVIDDFDAVTELKLRLLGHGENGSDELAGFHFFQGRDPGGITFFKVRSITGHLLASHSFLGILEQFLSQSEEPLLFAPIPSLLKHSTWFCSMEKN